MNETLLRALFAWCAKPENPLPDMMNYGSGTSFRFAVGRRYIDLDAHTQRAWYAGCWDMNTDVDFGRKIENPDELLKALDWFKTP